MDKEEYTLVGIDAMLNFVRYMDSFAHMRRSDHERIAVNYFEYLAESKRKKESKDLR